MNDNEKLELVENFLKGQAFADVEIYNNYNFCGIHMVVISAYHSLNFLEVLKNEFGNDWEIQYSDKTYLIIMTLLC